MKQFEIWWAELPAPIGRRPVLLLTRTPAYGYLNSVIVAEITTNIRGIPQELPLGLPEGLKQASVANMDAIHVVPKRLLSSRVGALSVGAHTAAKKALGYALDWPELKAP